MFLSFVFFIILSAFMQDAEPVKLSWKIILPIVLGIYEVIARLIPTVNDWSPLSWIIRLVNMLNEFLNRKKKK
jgi:hypothetical protein